MIEEISHFSSVLSSHQVCKLTPKLSHYVYSVHDQGISSKLGHVTSKRYFLTISYETYLKHVAFFITPLVVSSASTEKNNNQQLLRPRKCLSKRHRMEVMSEGGSSWIEDEEEHPVCFLFAAATGSGRARTGRYCHGRAINSDMEHVETSMWPIASDSHSVIFLEISLI